MQRREGQRMILEPMLGKGLKYVLSSSLLYERAWLTFENFGFSIAQ